MRGVLHAHQHRDPHHREPHRRHRHQRHGPPRRRLVQPPGRRRVDRRDGGAVPRAGPRGGQGPRRGRHRRGRPRRADLEDPLRVDAARLRDLVRRRGDGARLRDLVGRAGRVDPLRLRGHGGRRRDRRARGPGRGDARQPARAQARLAARGGRRRRAGRPRRGCLRRRRGAASYRAHPGLPRHADLHLGYDGPPQGLHAHPRQLHVRARRRGRGAAPALRRRGLGDPALPAARPRVRADHPDRRDQGAGAAWATPPT